MYSGFLILFTILGFSYSHSPLNPDVYKWENGMIPLEIKGNFDQIDLRLLNASIDSFHNKTCVKFVPHINEENFVTFHNTPSNCWSTIGQFDGKKDWILSQRRNVLRNVIYVQEELMYILGFEKDDTYEALNDDDCGYINKMYDCEDTTGLQEQFQLSE